MIDTVAMTISLSETVDIDGGIESWDVVRRTGAYTAYVKNPPQDTVAEGTYFPRVTAYRRAGMTDWELDIKVELSLPKLMYGNNLDELKDAQFGSVVTTLQKRLKAMGISVSRNDVRLARVSAVHYSKNILLHGGYTAQYVISELGKANVGKRFDAAKVHYRNDGQSLTFHTSTNAFVAYDKKADLVQAKSRSIDKEPMPKQKDFAEQLRRDVEVLRLEIRLQKKQKLNALFKSLGYPENPTLEDVFSTKKSRAVVGTYWQKMIDNNPPLLFAPSFGPKEFLKQTALVYPMAKTKELVYLTGLVLLAQDGNGMRELRTILAPRMDNRTWYRHVKDLKELSAGITALKPRGWHGQVVQQLGRYPPVRLATLLKVKY